MVDSCYIKTGPILALCFWVAALIEEFTYYRYIQCFHCVMKRCLPKSGRRSWSVIEEAWKEQVGGKEYILVRSSNVGTVFNEESGEGLGTIGGHFM